ncbi:MAG: ATP-dependent DNA helicase, partial [bacterium]
MKEIFQNLLGRKLPDYRFRPEQLAMAEAVDDVLKRCGHLVVEAPTGTGKTFAYLIPALKSGLKVVVSTGTRNLQEQLYYKDLPVLKSILGDDFSACYMKGRSNYLCYKRFLSNTRQGVLPGTYQAKIYSRINKWLEKTETGDRSELEFLPDKSPLWMEICSRSELCDNQKCSHFRDCFITRMKKRAYKSDLIVVNHHLFFADLALKRGKYGQVIPDFDAVIFDEAHQLEDTVTGYFGTTVSNYNLRELAGDCLKELSGNDNKKAEETAGKLGNCSEAFFNIFFENPGKHKLQPLRKRTDLLEAVKKLLDKLELLVASLMALPKVSEELQSCSRRALELHTNLKRIMTEDDPQYVYWYETRNKGVFLNISPIDVSETLKENLYRQSQR